MNRIAFRSFHAHLKTHRQAWLTPATRSTWHSQRQPSKSCRRQFHVSSPQRSAPTTPIEFVDPIQSTVLFDATQSIPAAYIFLAVGIIIPHYLRYLSETRATGKAVERYNVGAPLEIVHSAFVSRGLGVLAKNTTSTNANSEQLDSVSKLSDDFANRINAKYSEPYSTWVRRKIVPPAVHISWTTFMLALVSPVPGAVTLDPNTLSQLSTHMGFTFDHCAGVAFLLVTFMGYIMRNNFWHSWPSHYVRQMSPWLKTMYGLNSTAPGRTRREVIPFWLVELNDFFTSDKAKRDLQRGNILPPNFNVEYFIAWSSVVVVMGTFAWGLTLQQGAFLVATMGAAQLRRIAYDKYEDQLGRKVYKTRRKWVPMTPYY